MNQYRLTVCPGHRNYYSESIVTTLTIGNPIIKASTVFWWQFEWLCFVTTAWWLIALLQSSIICTWQASNIGNDHLSMLTNPKQNLHFTRSNPIIYHFHLGSKWADHHWFSLLKWMKWIPCVDSNMQWDLPIIFFLIYCLQSSQSNNPITYPYPLTLGSLPTQPLRSKASSSFSFESSACW